MHPDRFEALAGEVLDVAGVEALGLGVGHAAHLHHSPLWYGLASLPNSLVNCQIWSKIRRSVT